MANNGDTGFPNQLHGNRTNDNIVLYTAFRWRSIADFGQLSAPTGYSDATAVAGNFGGNMAGNSDGPNQGIMPVFWTDESTFTRYNNGSISYGIFLDVNASGACAGYYEEADGDRVVCFGDASTITIRTNPSGYIGADSRAINAQGYLGGKVYGGTDGSPAAVWIPDGNGNFNFHKSTSVSDWSPYSGRAAYIIGITDVKSGDSDSSYAVGWLEPSSTAGGQAFVWSLRGGGTGQRIRFLGTVHGIPTQVSNRDYTASDPVVSFTGNTPVPYIWLGSPSPTAANNGVADDVYAFPDPEVLSHTAGAAPTATGMTRDFHFGGTAIYDTADQWMTLDSVWRHLTAAPTHTIPTGTGVGGSLADMTFADGKYFTAQKGFAPFSGAPEMVVQVEETLDAGLVGEDFGLAVRATGRREDTGSYARKLDLWDWTTSAWVNVASNTTYEVHMSTNIYALSGWSNVSKFVESGSRKIKARLTAKQPLINPVSNWRISVEQLRVMVDQP